MSATVPWITKLRTAQKERVELAEFRRKHKEEQEKRHKVRELAQDLTPESKSRLKKMCIPAIALALSSMATSTERASK